MYSFYSFNSLLKRIAVSRLIFFNVSDAKVLIFLITFATKNTIIMKLTTITTLTIAAAIVMGCRSNGANNQDSANEPTVISYDEDSTGTTQDATFEEEIIP